MKIEDINRYKRYTENGEYQNGSLQRLADRYSQQNASAISPIDIIISSNRANIIYREGIEYKCIVDYGKMPSRTNLTSYQMKTYREVWTRRVDNFNTGDIVEFAMVPDDYKTYLILNKVQTRDNYDLSIMQAADGTIRWLNAEGTIKETPFVLKSSPTGSALQEDKIMILSKERRNILVQSNDDTKEIKHDKRFIFDERVWKVVGFNGLTKGILDLTLEEDVLNSAVDNMDLRIANYNPKEGYDPPSTPDDNLW